MPNRDPHAHVVYTPVVPRSNDTRNAAGRAGARSAGDDGARKAGANPFLRAENEDDDGYNPYSDRPADPNPLFEANPWD